MTTTEKKRYTVEEFMALPDRDDGVQYELVNGELVEMQGPNAAHTLVVENLQYHLGTYVRQNNLGRVLCEGVFAYNSKKPNTARKPDLAFAQAAQLANIDSSKPFLFAPELAIEVVSATDVMDDVFQKVREYLSVGVRLVWVIHPNTQIIFVYRRVSGMKPQPYGIHDELNGEDVIPGFSIKVADLFEGVQEATEESA